MTGANRGIGSAITDAVLERGGKKVYATAREPKTLEALTQSGDGILVKDAGSLAYLRF